jgi:hypothetical protein
MKLCGKICGSYPTGYGTTTNLKTKMHQRSEINVSFVFLKNTVVNVNSLIGVELNGAKEPKVSKVEPNGLTIVSRSGDNTIPRSHVGMTGRVLYNGQK